MDLELPGARTRDGPVSTTGRSRRWVALVAAGGRGAAAADHGSSDARRSPALVPTARAAIVGVPIAVGLGIWLQAANDRFGLLLVAVGGVSLVTTLAESTDDGLPTPWAGRPDGFSRSCSST